MADLPALRALTGTMRVLLVDDDDGVRTQLAAVLEALFAQVDTATNGAEALAMWQVQPEPVHDLVITDIRMPVMDGLAMVQAMHAVDPEQRIVVISGHNESGYLRQAIEYGVDGFVIKPVQAAQLYAVLTKVATAVQLRRDNRAYQQDLEAMVEARTAELRRQMVTDSLTGLYNLSALQHDLESASSSSLLLINLDNFDHVNAVYGYPAGDHLLQQVAQWLLGQKPEAHTLYRIGSDEFVCRTAATDEATLVHWAERLVTTCPEQRFGPDGFPLRLGVTVGLATGFGEAVLRQAHIALKEARLTSKSRYAGYRAGSPLEAQQRETLAWLHTLREALAADAVVPYYQPIICNRRGAVTRYECLARLQLGEQVVSPARFIEPARLGGLLPQITRAMIDQSFACFARRTEGFSINISEADLKDGYLIDYLAQVTRRHPGTVRRATLEVLEEVSVQGSDAVLDQLAALREMGFAIALDDFGSERSNFSRLLNLPVDLIKIDGRFIRDLAEDPNSFKITRAITELARHLEAAVVAEFVHSAPVQARVLALGIDYSQGFVFGAPERQPGPSLLVEAA